MEAKKPAVSLLKQEWGKQVTVILGEQSSRYNLAWLNYQGQADQEAVLQSEMAKLGLNAYAQKYMAPKGAFYVFRAENIKNPAANIIKQEFLAKGAEAAIHPMVVVNKAPSSAVLMLGTERQYQQICDKFRRQQFGLPALAAELEQAIANIKTTRWAIPYGAQGKKQLKLGGQTLVMGILNMTPDSFSDGGSYHNVAAAVAKGEAMAAAGAAILDVGGESTRPNYQAVTLEEEIARVTPVITALKQQLDVPVSIDTYKPEVAAAALAAGADLINDIWGLQSDPQMARVAAQYQAPVIAMHNQNHQVYGKAGQYQPELNIKGDLLGDVLAFFRRSVELGLAAGMQENQFIFDIGFGFGKDWRQNLEALQGLAGFKVLGRPLLIGTSKKSTIGQVLQKDVGGRAWGTAATTAYGVAAGAQIVRVHDVAETVDVVKMTDAICQSRASLAVET